MPGRIAFLVLLFAPLIPLLAQAPGKGLVIVLIGPPGGGKSTQAEFLRRKYTIAALNVDEMRRKAPTSRPRAAQRAVL